jgi:hypothetical protein
MVKKAPESMMWEILLCAINRAAPAFSRSSSLLAISSKTWAAATVNPNSQHCTGRENIAMQVCQ